MFVIFIHIKSRDKISSAQSKGAQTTFGLSTFDVGLGDPPIGGSPSQRQAFSSQMR